MTEKLTVSLTAADQLAGLVVICGRRSGVNVTDFLDATNGTPGGPWALLQSTNLALPLNQWQINITGTFDGSGNLSTNIPNTATNKQDFYILKVQ